MGGRLIDWLGFTAPSLISVGSHCASKKAGFSRRQCSGLYLYPSSCPVAELFTITNSRRTRCLPEGPFSHGIYSRFLWDDLSIRIFLMKGVGRRRRKNPELVGTALRCQCRRLLFLPGIKGERLPSSLGFICHSARFIPGNQTSQSHSAIQGHCEERYIFIPWLYTRPPLLESKQSKR